MKNVLKRDRRTDLEKKFDSKLEKELDAAEDLADLNEVAELMKIRAELRKKGISADAKATIAANLLGIGLILSYERMQVITTKAMGFVLRGRV